MSDARKVLVHIIVKGNVQGVGYRYYCQSQAKVFGINGWVRNLRNGDVELEIEGSDDNVNEFMKNLREGSNSARVDDIIINKSGNKNFYDGFEIRGTI